MIKKKKLLFIDLNWTYNRYYYVQSMKSPNKPQHATNKALLEFFKRIESNADFDKVFVLVDGKNPQTMNLYENYKGGRACKDEVYKGLEDFLKLASKLNNFIVLQNDLAEADELIAYMCKKHHDHTNITIYSGDKDLLQLATYSTVHVSNSYSQGLFTLLSTNEILNKFSNSTKTKQIDSLDKILTYKVFKGDSSDNIPAPVKGIRFDQLLLFLDLLGTSPCFNEKQFMRACSELKSTNKKLAEQLLEAQEDIKRNYKLISLLDFTDKDYIVQNTMRVK